MRVKKTTWSNIKDVVLAVVACALVLLAVMGFTWIKVEAYGGNPECLFIRCVKVVP